MDGQFRLRRCVASAVVVALGLLPIGAPTPAVHAHADLIGSHDPPAPPGSNAGIAHCVPQQGPRVQVVYARAQDRPDRFAAQAHRIREFAVDADFIFNESAAETGAMRRLRFVHDGNCLVTVQNQVVPATADDSVQNLFAALRNAFDNPERKWMVFFDGTPAGEPSTVCGRGDMATPNAGGDQAIGISYVGCWSGGTAAHELGHNMGAVSTNAAHDNGVGHCLDEHDLMCQADPGQPTPAIVCSDEHHDRLFDCNHDDYFHTDSGFVPDHNIAFGAYLVVPAAGTSSVWRGNAQASQSFHPGESMDTIGGYTPVTGQFRGSNLPASIMWYQAGAQAEFTWHGQVGNTRGFMPGQRASRIDGSYVPIGGDFDGDGADDLFLYGPGNALDVIWWGSSQPGARLGDDQTSSAISGVYTPLAGDFDHDGSDDILWYAPGSDADSIWWGIDKQTGAPRASTPIAQGINGFYEPFVGDFDGDLFDDVFFYAPGGANDDSIWWGAAPAAFGLITQQMSIWGTYRIAVGRFNADTRDDIFLHAPGSGADHVWWGIDKLTGTVLGSSSYEVNGDYRLLTGNFDGDGAEDLFFYDD